MGIANIDIDFFTDLPYGTIDFDAITDYLEANFPYVDYLSEINPAMGKFFFIGENKENCIKPDVFYTDTFIQPPLVEDAIRMASIEDIVAMKTDVVQRGGRKKDFWDLHALLASFRVCYEIKRCTEVLKCEQNRRSNFVLFRDVNDANSLSYSKNLQQRKRAKEQV